VLVLLLSTVLLLALALAPTYKEVTVIIFIKHIKRMVQRFYLLCYNKEEQEPEQFLYSIIRDASGFRVNLLTHPVSFDLPTMCTK
jgi:hypothetical protein